MIKLVNDNSDHTELISVADLYEKLAPEDLKSLPLPNQNGRLLILSWLPYIQQINFKNYEYGDSDDSYCMITFWTSSDPLTIYNSDTEWILENITEDFYS